MNDNNHVFFCLLYRSWSQKPDNSLMNGRVEAIDTKTQVQLVYNTSTSHAGPQNYIGHVDMIHAGHQN